MRGSLRRCPWDDPRTRGSLRRSLWSDPDVPECAQPFPCAHPRTRGWRQGSSWRNLRVSGCVFRKAWSDLGISGCWKSAGDAASASMASSSMSTASAEGIMIRDVMRSNQLRRRNRFWHEKLCLRIRQGAKLIHACDVCLTSPTSSSHSCHVKPRRVGLTLRPTSPRPTSPPRPPSPTPHCFAMLRGEGGAGAGKRFWLPLSTSGVAAKLERGPGG